MASLQWLNIISVSSTFPQSWNFLNIVVIRCYRSDETNLQLTQKPSGSQIPTYMDHGLSNCCVRINIMPGASFTNRDKLHNHRDWGIHVNKWDVMPLTCPNFNGGHRNGKVVRLTALVFTGDVEACLQRLQWVSGLSTWWPIRLCTLNWTRRWS